MTHRIAVMQPYFLPYLGYWQLLDHVDEFVIYDTVQYIDRRWMNRNRIRLGGRLRWLTLPVARGPQIAAIRERSVTAAPEWRTRMLDQVAGAYRLAEHREQGMHLLSSIVATDRTNLADFLARSIRIVAERLGIDTRLRMASELDLDPGVGREERILAACHQLGATDYYNLSGGAAMYSADHFAQAGVTLWLRDDPALPAEGTPEYDDPMLSVLDLFMRRDLTDISGLVAAGAWMRPLSFGTVVP